MTEKVKITIDGKEYEVEAGANLLQTCLDLGLMVPHFCYHEALGPAGSCRLCAAMVAPGKDKPARLEMTCMVRVADGMVVSIQHPYAQNFRKGVIEYLMLNHPHDCPVCDEGGECMLQDMTVLTEHNHRRNRFPKRTWRNQYLGPLIHHEMNRCITCYRCVRFYRDYALGKDFGVFGSRDRVYFGRVRDGVLESEFAGNLVDVCPTGVFTNKRFREVYARPWDLLTAHSVCIHCGVGCNLLVGGRHKTLRRVKPSPNAEVNKFFICDRGRYGGEFVNSPKRLKKAFVDGKECSVEEATNRAVSALREVQQKYGPSAIAGVGSARASLEANAALALLLKCLGSSNLVYHSSDEEHSAVRLAAHLVLSRELPTPTLSDIENADFVLCIGGDVTGEAPMVDLAIRQVLRKGGRLFVLSPRAGKLDEFAHTKMRARPDSISEIVGHLMSALTQKDHTLTPELSEILHTLGVSKRPVVVCSTLHGDPWLVQAAFEFARIANQPARPCSLAYCFEKANSFGVAIARETVQPSSLLVELEKGNVKALVVLERDLQDLARSVLGLEKVLKACEIVVVLDSHQTPTTDLGNIVLPVLPHYLSSGIFVNYEGRAQRSNGLPLPSNQETTSADLLVKMVSKLAGEAAYKDTKYSDIFEIDPSLDECLDNLEAGQVGIRLHVGSTTSFQQLRPHPSPDRFALWEVYSCFGSEELSMFSPPIAELSPPPYVELNPADAAELGFTEGQKLTQVAGFSVVGQLRLNEDLAQGTVAIPKLYTHSKIRADVEVSQ